MVIASFLVAGSAILLVALGVVAARSDPAAEDWSNSRATLSPFGQFDQD